MRKYLAVFVVFAAFMGNAEGAQRTGTGWHTFYRTYDKSIDTKEKYLAKIEKPREMNVTREEILTSARKSFKRDFKTWDEYKAFIRSSEVSVSQCTFRQSPVEHVEFNPRRVATNIRDFRRGELCMNFKDKEGVFRDAVIFDCGQGLLDMRPSLLLPAPRIVERIVPAPEKPLVVAKVPEPIFKPYRDESRSIVLVPHDHFYFGVGSSGGSISLGVSSYTILGQDH